MSEDRTNLSRYAIYLVLFISTLYVSTSIVPLLNTLIGQSHLTTITVSLLVPLATGLIVTELFERDSLLRTGLAGTVYISIASSLGEITNQLLKVLNKKINEVYTGNPSQEMIDAGVSGIIGNLDSAGVNPFLVFLGAAAGYNLPIVYRYIHDQGENDYVYLALYVFPVVLTAALVYLTGLLMSV